MSGDWIAQLTALGEPSAAAIAGSVTGDAAREAVLDALCGLNVRTRTEVATRRRLLAEQSNLLAGVLALEAAAAEDTPTLLPALAGVVGPDAPRTVGRTALRTRLMRLVGLPGKTLTNLANRGEDKAVVARDYVDMVDTETRRAAEQLTAALPAVEICIGGRPVRAPLELLLTLMTAGGGTALSVRGSDKSANGKALEREMLGALLRMLGLTQVAPDTAGDNVFWLSYLDDDRECDATVLLPGGRAVMIDLGLIGDGNPEISKDKLSRFARATELGGTRRSVTTVVIVDKLSAGSSAWQAARDLGALLVQMSDSQWVTALRADLVALGLPPEPSTELAAQLGAAGDPAARRTVLDRFLPAAPQVSPTAAAADAPS